VARYGRTQADQLELIGACKSRSQPSCWNHRAAEIGPAVWFDARIEYDSEILGTCHSACVKLGCWLPMNTILRLGCIPLNSNDSTEHSSATCSTKSTICPFFAVWNCHVRIHRLLNTRRSKSPIKRGLRSTAFELMAVLAAIKSS